MFVCFRSKKAVSELVSFILILLLVVIASSIAYLFATDLLEEREAQYNEQRMEATLKRYNAEVSNIITVDRRATTVYLDFTKGQIIFEDNQISYSSLARFNGTNYCLGLLCYESINGFTRISTNITSPYTFNSNLTLGPGNYLLLLEHIQNETQVRVQIR